MTYLPEYLRPTPEKQAEMDAIYGEAKPHLRRDLLTYGGLGLDVFNRLLKTAAAQLGIPYVRSEVAPEEDEALGLRIPHVWYMSQNPDMIGIAEWYIHFQADKQAASKDNQELKRRFGTVGVVECYRRNDLIEFAKDNGYGVFSVPFDLVATTRHITTNVADLDASTPEQKRREFIKDVLGNAAKRENKSPEDVAQLLADIRDEKARHLEVLKLMRYYWQDVLVPRGIQLEDEDVILIDIKSDRPAGETLDVTRSPFLVFVGGNLDHPSGSESSEEILQRNIELAQAQYPPGTHIIAPCFKVGDRKVPFTLRQENPKEVTPETLLLSLLVLREMGQVELYNKLLARYEELCNLT